VGVTNAGRSVCHPNHASPEPEPSLGLQAAWISRGVCEGRPLRSHRHDHSTSPLWIGIDVAKDHLESMSAPPGWPFASPTTRPASPT